MLSSQPENAITPETSQSQNDNKVNKGSNPPEAYENNDIKRFAQPYIGLPNQGATCYMNSLLQTLFMTPEFRSALYGWKYDENMHARPQDCIPFQLQKLFASLQLKHAGCVSTKPLTKSFQWEESTSFEQHDIQEFSSVLFDAIEQSTTDVTNETLINDLYEGTSVNYVKCLECTYESTRPESFINLGLTVKNTFDKIYNESLEKALQIYLKPEKLEGSNQYFCELCNKKSDAIKGTKFVKMPKLLNLFINRFSFDLIYLRRVKLDDFFTFPFILNMNDYINGYEGIKNKVDESSNPEYFNEFKPKKPVNKTVPKKDTTSKNPTPQTVGGKPVRSQARSFIDDIKKKGAQKNKQDIDVVIYTKNLEDMGPPPPLTETNDIVTRYGAVNDQNIESHVTQASTSGSNSQAVSQNDLEEVNKAKSRPKPADFDTLDGVDQFGISPSKKIKKDFELVTNETKSKSGSAVMDQEESKEDPEVKRLAEEREVKQKQERKELINKYLQDGPLVYELYSILIHSGGAYGGHYYAYIKSFEDGKWYNFNDTTVTKIDQDDIPGKAFGGGKSANAYMLIYRQVDNDQEYQTPSSDGAIPEYLKTYIEEEAKKQFEVELQKVEKAKNLKIRVYNKLEAESFPAHMDETFNDFQKKVLEAYKIKEKPENVRLRVYHAMTDTMQETFTNKGDKTLAELKINPVKNFCIEIKKDDEQFEEYDADMTYFKIALWRENLPDLSDDTLRPEKVFVNKEGVLKDLIEAISKKFNIPFEQIRLVKKSQIGGFPTADILNGPETMDKKYTELRIFEGSTLFVERAETPDAPLIWKEEFDRDAYNFKIKFNSPYTEAAEPTTDYSHFVMIDSRKTLRELKFEVCKILELSDSDIIMRKGGKMGTEVKDMRQTMQSANYVNGSSVFIEFGKPTIVGEMRVFVYLAVKREGDEEDDMLSHDFQDLFELIISSENTAAEIKELIALEAKRTKKYDWDPKKMRLREKVGPRLVRVYRNTSAKQQNICDKKQIAIELLDEPETLAPKDYLIVCRIWNPETLEMGKRFEVVIDKTKSLKHLAERIFEKDQSISIENMMGCKVLGAWKLIRYDLLFQDWTNFDDENNMIYSHPLYLSVDGTLIFIKDKNLKHKELNDEEKKNIGVARVHHKQTHTSGGTYTAAAEKSLKIHVKKKEDNNPNETGGEGVPSQGEISENAEKFENIINEDQEKGDESSFQPFF